MPRHLHPAPLLSHGSYPEVVRVTPECSALEDRTRLASRITLLYVHVARFLAARLIWLQVIPAVLHVSRLLVRATGPTTRNCFAGTPNTATRALHWPTPVVPTRDAPSHLARLRRRRMLGAFQNNICDGGADLHRSRRAERNWRKSAARLAETHDVAPTWRMPLCCGRDLVGDLRARSGRPRVDHCIDGTARYGSKLQPPLSGNRGHRLCRRDDRSSFSTVSTYLARPTFSLKVDSFRTHGVSARSPSEPLLDIA